MRFAEVVNDFSQKMKELGPLGEKEGIEEEVLKFRLETVKDLIPYIKLVERERLRIPVRSAKVYQDFFTSEEFERLFRELIADPLEASQIMALLREKPRSTSEISRILGLSPSEISRHLDYSARQGLVTFDETQDLVAAA
jgi:NADH-quinone oxidoreductase subunit E